MLSATAAAPGPYMASGASGLFYGNLCLIAADAQYFRHPGSFCKDLGKWGGRRGNEAA